MITLDMLIVAHILVGLITAYAFKFLVINKLTPQQHKTLDKLLESNTDLNTVFFIEYKCNTSVKSFFCKAMMFMLFMSGILAPVGFWKLNKELTQ